MSGQTCSKGPHQSSPDPAELRTVCRTVSNTFILHMGKLRLILFITQSMAQSSILKAGCRSQSPGELVNCTKRCGPTETREISISGVEARSLYFLKGSEGRQLWIQVRVHHLAAMLLRMGPLSHRAECPAVQRLYSCSLGLLGG